MHSLGIENKQGLFRVRAPFRPCLYGSREEISPVHLTFQNTAHEMLVVRLRLRS